MIRDAPGPASFGQTRTEDRKPRAPETGGRKVLSYSIPKSHKRRSPGTRHQLYTATCTEKYCFGAKRLAARVEYAETRHSRATQALLKPSSDYACSNVPIVLFTVMCDNDLQLTCEIKIVEESKLIRDRRRVRILFHPEGEHSPSAIRACVRAI
jgi:hypothetical protein